MRSDKIRDISMNFDSIAATSLDVSYDASVTSASDPLSAENRTPRFTFNRNGWHADPPCSGFAV